MFGRKFSDCQERAQGIAPKLALVARRSVCPHCGETTGWVLPDGRRVSVTAGTIFHRTRTPLTVWFEATWLVTTRKQGANALGLQRVLGVGSHQTAWSILHRLRTAMFASGR